MASWRDQILLIWVLVDLLKLQLAYQLFYKPVNEAAEILQVIPNEEKQTDGQLVAFAEASINRAAHQGKMMEEES